MELINENIESKKKRLNSILRILKKEYPEAKIELNYRNTFELLVSTILSAQCTDKRVNIVTEKLFKKYIDISDYIKIPVEQLEQDIYSTGFYKAKAKNIKASAKKIINDFNGNVPDNMEDLLSLPGVGRKTANVILGHCFVPAGIVVDTHVKRIATRLEFTQSNNPDKIEQDLIEIVPKRKWTIFTHYLIRHGRKVCASRKAKCNDCKISKYCPSSSV